GPAQLERRARAPVSGADRSCCLHGDGRRRGDARHGRTQRRTVVIETPDVTEKGAQVSDDRVSKNDTAPRKVKVESGEGLHPLPWPYSHGWRVGNLLFIAGQVALDEELRLIGPGDAEEQARQVWRNIKVAVEKAGGKLAHVVRVSTY